MTSIWDILGIEPTRDRDTIRRAYAARLKETNPEDDPEGFKALREAYDYALKWAGTVARGPEIVVVRPEAAAVESSPEPVRGDIEAPAIPEARSEPSPVSRSGRRAQVRVQAALQGSNAFFDALRALEIRLRPGSDHNDDARLQALDDLLRLPDLERIETREQTETWLLRLLCGSIPRSDALIGVARGHFGWEEDTIDHGRRGDAGMKAKLFEREADIALLQQIARPGSEHYRAFRVLNRPPVPETWRSRLFADVSPSEVRALLVLIQLKRPSVERELNPETVAAWEVRLKHARFDGLHLWMALLTVPSLAALALTAWLEDRIPADLGRSAGPVFVLAVAVPAIWTIVRSLAFLVYIWPRRAWQRYSQDRDGPWLSFSGLGVLFVLFALAALPLSPALGELEILLTLAIIWGAVITGQLEKSPGKWAPPVRLLFGSGAALLFWLVGLRSPMEAETKTLLSIAFTAGVVVIGYGRPRALQAWAALKAGFRLTAVLAQVAICAAGATGLWLTQDSVSPAAFSLVAITLLCHQWTFPFGRAWPSSAVGRVGFYVAATVFLRWSGDGIGVAIAATALTAWLAINGWQGLSRAGEEGSGSLSGEEGSGSL